VSRFIRENDNMPILEVSEFIDTSNGNLVEPPIAHSTHNLADEPVTIRLHRQARALRLLATADCRISIGIDPDAPKWLLSAGEAERRIVTPGERFCIHAVASSGDGQGRTAAAMNANAFIDLLTIIANPTKYEAAIKKFMKAQSDMESAAAKFKDVRAKSATLDRDRTAFAAECDAERVRLADERGALEGDRQRLADDRAVLDAARQRLVDDRAKLDASVSDHAAQLADLARLRKALAA
jgi:hypothetical protein